MKINKKFFCILNIEAPNIGLLALPYLLEKKKYTPLFIFPKTSTNLDDILSEENPLYNSQQRAMSFVNEIYNKFRMLNGCENIVFIGLNHNQQSYLECFGSENIISIDDEIDIEHNLKPINIKTGILKCRSEEIIKGAILALDKNFSLEIDEESDLLTSTEYKKDKLVIIEDNLECSTLIGINYAIYSSSVIEIISTPSIPVKKIKNLIYRWKKSENQTLYHDLSSEIYPSIQEIDFSIYKIATFFTYGVPYPLILGNEIPFTMVNTSYIPDQFVFNTIIDQINKFHNCAIVFSPKEFDEEETEFLITELGQKDLFVHPIIGQDATVYNTDCTILEFPYDILHICSHGGEVDGYNITETLKDRFGTTHSIEYDEVESIKMKGNESGTDKVELTRKFIYRKFNGYHWKSKELEEQNYSSETYADITNAVGNPKPENKTYLRNVDDSCSIKCVDGNYQAMVPHIAGKHTFPFIFNNTCWSWSNIAEGFLSTSCSGYIGTLWNIRNRTAIDIAKEFYKNGFRKSIANNLFDCMDKTIINESDKNIYIYWGLQESYLFESKLPEPKKYIASRLVENYRKWQDWLSHGLESKHRRSIEKLIDWNLMLIKKDFFLELKESVANIVTATNNR